jgi:membrane protein YqaA with SNARE-associated domain
LTDFLESIFGFFLTPWGLFLLGILDLSVLFYVPFALDMALVFTVARSETAFFWVYPLLATAGSLTGGVISFWLGRRIGEKGLGRIVPEERLKKVKQKVHSGGAMAMALPAVLPPPFPFKVFVLASGALEMDRRLFFTTMAAMRLLRFGGESVLAVLYGERILAWMRSDVFQGIIIGFIVLAIGGTAYSIYRVARQTRRS